MTDYTPLGKNQFYCNICHGRFERGRNAIQDHERSQKHKRAKEKETKRLMSKPKEKTEEQKYQEEVERLDAINRAKYSGAPVPQANKPTGPKGAAGKGDKHPGAPGESGYGKRGDDNRPLPKQELGLSLKDNQNFIPGGNMFAGVWTLAKDDETGKLVFFNRQSGTKHAERPRGVKLSPADEKKWEDYKNNPTQSVDVLLNPEISQANIGGWEEVETTEDYYATHAVEPEVAEAPEEIINEEEIKFEENLEEKAERLNELNQEEIEELYNLDKPEEGKSLLRAKTDKLKKLIDSNIEIVSKPTFQKDSDILYKRNLEDRGFDGDEQEAGRQNGMFKKRKPQGNKRVILGFDNENELE